MSVRTLKTRTFTAPADPVRNPFGAVVSRDYGQEVTGHRVTVTVRTVNNRHMKTWQHYCRVLELKTTEVDHCGLQPNGCYRTTSYSVQCDQFRLKELEDMVRRFKLGLYSVVESITYGEIAVPGGFRGTGQSQAGAKADPPKHGKLSGGHAPAVPSEVRAKQPREHTQEKVTVRADGTAQHGVGRTTVGGGGLDRGTINRRPEVGDTGVCELSNDGGQTWKTYPLRAAMRHAMPKHFHEPLWLALFGAAPAAAVLLLAQWMANRAQYQVRINGTNLAI